MAFSAELGCDSTKAEGRQSSTSSPRPSPVRVSKPTHPSKTFTKRVGQSLKRQFSGEQRTQSPACRSMPRGSQPRHTCESIWSVDCIYEDQAVPPRLKAGLQLEVVSFAHLVVNSNDEVMITMHGTAMQLARLRLIGECSVCLTVCSARKISCRHEPWPKGSVLSAGWQRKLLTPGRIVIILNSQVGIGRKVSPRRRSKGKLGSYEENNTTADSCRTAAVVQRVHEPATSASLILRKSRRRGQRQGALRGLRGTRYIAKPKFDQGTDTELTIAWSGVPLLTDPRWGVSTVSVFHVTFGLVQEARPLRGIVYSPPHSMGLADLPAHGSE